jgi:hypothetical protein
MTTKEYVGTKGNPLKYSEEKVGYLHAVEEDVLKGTAFFAW